MFAAIAATAMLAAVGAAVVSLGEVQLVGIGSDTAPLTANGVEWGAPAPNGVVASDAR
ncbi:hypothetical protein KIF24_03225 [Micromonospora sp. Llam7]|uniref:hypothetical protein n=1 Tax=Micromonospora tarapacensis TaxID=2835305 RepID=UPI001C83C67B|nr:hypothetical protein [Micromonospora tarapacensis]MBX7265161.1 hypothetical protein [Micromonospora tarapacensis]